MLKVKADYAKSQQKTVPVCLMMDEMSIRQDVSWNSNKHKMEGKVSPFENLIASDKITIAKEALVFLVSSLNETWKIPVGYFFVSGVCAEEKANMILSLLRELHETGVDVHAFTFDGLPANFSVVEKLGVRLSNL